MSRQWGRNLAGGAPIGTLSGDIDEAIKETRACASRGDESEILAAINEMIRLFARYESFMKNRFMDRRGRSPGYKLEYLRRGHAFQSAQMVALLALPGDEAAERAAKLESSIESLVSAIEAEENQDPGREGA